MLQSQKQESGPAEGTGALPVVPTHAMSTLPSSPAAGWANTLVCRSPWGAFNGMSIGADQVLPSLVEYAYLRMVSPRTWPPVFTGACSQTTYRFPALSMAMVGKFAPVFAFVPRFATVLSSQFRPLGSLTFGTTGPKGTGKHLAIEILFSSALSVGT